jgi:hypothetical protein
MKVYFEKVHIAQASIYLFLSFFLSFLFGEVSSTTRETLLDHLHHKIVEQWNSV